MIKDHFAHSILPPRPPSRRPFQVIVTIVILVAASALAVVYWPMLSTFVASGPAPASPQGTLQPQGTVSPNQTQDSYQQAVVQNDASSSTGLTASQDPVPLQSTTSAPRAEP